MELSAVTLTQIIAAAASLFDANQIVSPDASEYERGVCELIGRIRLDVMGDGEGTGENAIDAAEAITALLT